MSNHINQQMRGREWGMLLVLSLLWGGSFFFIEVLVKHLPPLTIVTLRVALAAITLWMIILLRKYEVPKTAKSWTALIIIGLLNNALPFTLITWGQTHINSGLSSIFNATTPFFTVIVAEALLVDEKITANKIGGVMIGILGVSVLIGLDALKGISGSVLGQLAVLGAALSYAFAGVFARRFKALGISPLMVATGQVTTAAIMLTPLAFFIDKPWTLAVPPIPIIGAMLGLAFLSTVVAYILYFRLIASAGATNAALVTFIIPISAILLGVIILGETFTPVQAIGMALIGVGLIVMDGRLLKLR
jgi:drug/metabolite transporter (DMT)-like permease